MRIIDSATTRKHLGMPALIEALRCMFIAGCEVPTRHTHDLATPEGAGGTLLLMPAWQVGKRMGVKLVTIFPGNTRKRLHSIYTLFDATTGAPLAQLDGDEITARRTAAASALAASFLARDDAAHLLVVGAGRVASLMCEAMRAVRPITRVSVWNHHHDKAEALAATLRAGGVTAHAVQDLARAAREADIISAATLATAPLIHGAWLKPGTHLDLIGSFTPAMRESDAACFAGARVYVDTHEAIAKSGDILEAIAQGTFAPERLEATLAKLCETPQRGRTHAHDITIFKSVGTALEDFAAAELVYDAVCVAG